ncbi:MAG: hypothetical protein AVO38_04065 [delta proteobacterium ML8_D]|jgi:anaerobic magnesium-protoporphyrin IX monomethyl ester cyclase|nr:MAG: hypothetical protein AVO38_04065 [delta proteobacterium ML8_D]
MNVVFCYHTTDYEFNFSIALLSAALKPMHVNVSLVIFREIAGRPKDTLEETVQRIMEKKPDMVAFSIMTFNWIKIQKVITRLRRVFPSIIVVGGCHAILCPDDVLAFPGVDAVCPGDGEKPLQELVGFCQKHSMDSIPEIEGLRFKNSSSYNHVVPWCNEHLDAYPYLSFDIFDEERNQRLNQKITGMLSFAGIFSLPVITSRGCPYKCAYCNNRSFMEIFGGPKRFLRSYPASKVVADIKYLVERYQPDSIEFMDEMFLKHDRWMYEFCDAYSEEIGLPYTVLLRIDRCKEEIVRLLVNSGLKLVFFGLECGDETYRAKYLDRHMSNTDILKGAELLRRYDIMIVTSNMFGLPYETPEMIEKTISLNRKLQPDAVAPFIYQPLPKTKLGQMALEQGLAQPPPADQWDFLAPSLNSRELPATYVQKRVDAFLNEFNSPEKTMANISRIRLFCAGKPAAIASA